MCTMKVTSSKMQRHPAEWKKIYVHLCIQKRLIINVLQNSYSSMTKHIK